MNSVFDKPVEVEVQELSEGIAIVIDGDTAPRAIASGQFLYIKNHSTLPTGGYNATAAIASGDTISSSNVIIDADGIANAIKGNIDTLNSKTTISTTKIWANNIDLLIEKNNRITCCSGWILLNASSYTDQMPLFRLDETLTNFVYFSDNNGDVYRVKKNGEVIFHNPTTIQTDQYRFVSFAFCN